MGASLWCGRTKTASGAIWVYSLIAMRTGCPAQIASSDETGLVTGRRGVGGPRRVTIAMGRGDTMGTGEVFMKIGEPPLGEAWPHLLPQSEQPKHPWTCTCCGKVDYGPYSFEYAKYCCPPPQGWWLHVCGLGYGKDLILASCSEECKQKLHNRYFYHIVGPERCWDRVRQNFGLSANP